MSTFGLPKWHFNPFLFRFSLGRVFHIFNSFHVLKFKCGKKIYCLLSKPPDLAGGLKKEWRCRDCGYRVSLSKITSSLPGLCGIFGVLLMCRGALHLPLEWVRTRRPSRVRACAPLCFMWNVPCARFRSWLLSSGVGKEPGGKSGFAGVTSEVGQRRGRGEWGETIDIRGLARQRSDVGKFPPGGSAAEGVSGGEAGYPAWDLVCRGSRSRTGFADL